MRRTFIVAAMAIMAPLVFFADGVQAVLIGPNALDGSFASNLDSNNGTLGDNEDSNFWAIGLSNGQFESLNRSLGPDGGPQDTVGGSYVQNQGGTRSLTSNVFNLPPVLSAGSTLDFSIYTGANAITKLRWSATIDFSDGPDLTLVSTPAPTAGAGTVGVTVATDPNDWQQTVLNDVEIPASNLASTTAQLVLTFVNDNLAAGVSQSYVDNINLSVAVPEPSAFLCVGLVGMVALRRSRKAQR